MPAMKNSTPICAIIILIAAVCIFPDTAIAAGAFFPQSGKPAPTIAQVQCAVLLDNGQVTMVLQPYYSGDREPFAWVIPVPALPDTDCANTLLLNPFPKMDIRTDPTIGVVYFEEILDLGLSGGCAGAKEKEKRTGGDAFVYYRNVTKLIMSNVYTLARVTNSLDNTLEQWLGANGYESAGALALGADYLGRGWHFVVVEVTPQPDASLAYNEAMMPLVLDFSASDIVLPFKAMALNIADEAMVTVFIFADLRMHVTNYGLGGFSGPRTVQSSYDSVIRAQSRGRFVLEYVDYSPMEEFEDLSIASVITRPYMLTRMTGTFPAKGIYDDVAMDFWPNNRVVHPVSYITFTPGLTGRPGSGSGPGGWPLAPIAVFLIAVFIFRIFRRAGVPRHYNFGLQISE
jgi:hypothetical protein